MATVTKISSLGFDATGGTLKVFDSTGNYSSDTNTDGWGPPNDLKSNISKIVFSLGIYNSKDIFYQTYAPLNPDHPEWYTSPTVLQIANGAVISINSLTLRTSKPDRGIVAFRDGVYDINMYDIMQTVGGITGNVGDIYLYGIDFTPYYDYDAVEIAGVIYGIDKSKPTNANTILYLVKPLEESTDSFRPVLRSNVKVLNDAATSCRLQTMAARLPGLLDCGKRDKAVYNYRLVIDNMDAARRNFEVGNYSESDDLICAAQQLSQKVWGGCGC